MAYVKATDCNFGDEAVASRIQRIIDNQEDHETRMLAVEEGWWEELGRTTLGVAGDTISVASFSARKYLRIIASCLPSGQIRPTIRFNNDSASNYAIRQSVNGAADTASASQTVFSDATALTTLQVVTAEVLNIETQEKVGSVIWNSAGTAGAANVGTRLEGTSKWANTSAQITRVDVINTGTGDFASGSELVILGHD